VLHRVVRDHLCTFLEEAARRSDGDGLPSFIERAFRRLLTCGAPGRGFARFRCEDCGFERLVPYSCKISGLCSSCGGRRMAERSAHLVDEVLPHAPVRQWVLSLPHWLRYKLAYDHQLCRAVLGVYVRALLGFYRKRAQDQGIADGRTGTATVIMRFGSGLRLNIHFHTAIVDGVFTEQPTGQLRFHPAAAPTDRQVAELLASIHRRIIRLLERRGVQAPDQRLHDELDPLEDSLPALAGIFAASVRGQVALGPRAGWPVMRIGNDPNAPWVTSRGRRQAHLEGFDLHANVAVPSHDRKGLEQLCRYLLRPPICEDRLELLPDGRVLLKLKTEWSDGTSHLLFTPLEFIEKLAAILPRPRINLLIYHGLLAPNARLRAQVVAYGREPIQLEFSPHDSCAIATLEVDNKLPEGPTTLSPPKHGNNYSWSELMARAFDLDVLKCPQCGGKMRLLATIEEPDVVRKILKHLGLSTEIPEPRPARSPPEQTDLFLDA